LLTLKKPRLKIASLTWALLVELPGIEPVAELRGPPKKDRSRAGAGPELSAEN
jgi:hypothetical protein